MASGIGAIASHRTALAVLTSLLLSGCSQDSGNRASESGDLDAVFTRQCLGETIAFPDLSIQEDRDIQIGPVLFKAAHDFRGEADAKYLRARDWRPFKSVTVTRDGVEAVVEVEPESRSDFLLIYRNFRGGANYARADGDPSVHFTECPGRERPLSPEQAARAVPPRGEFNGGFIARAPGCYRLTVTSGSPPTTAEGQINIGLPEPKCPTAAH